MFGDILSSWDVIIYPRSKWNEEKNTHTHIQYIHLYPVIATITMIEKMGKGKSFMSDFKRNRKITLRKIW